jgi:uncharacterized protein YodC (DUF2158 family)
MASIKKHANGHWRARYYDGEGKQHAAHDLSSERDRAR